VARAQERIAPIAAQRTAAVKPRLARVLEAFAAERLGVHHFASVSGYGHGDLGREVLDRVFARVLQAEAAAVRLQFVSGTHAITAALFGVLRPGDRLLAITGRPYDTLEEVIGIRGSGQGSLAEFGIHYDELPLLADGSVDEAGLAEALAVPTRMVLIQRSCGYSWRPSLSVRRIGRLVDRVKALQPACVCFVDNCYGELVDDQEPTAVGADLLAGSLIKNLGGTIAQRRLRGGPGRSGGAGLLPAHGPGYRQRGGSSFDLNRLLFQGLFSAPQMVAEALISAELTAAVFSELGYAVNPAVGGERSDVIQAVRLGDAERLKLVCRAFQASSPVGSYLDPVPAPMPGYASELVMAGAASSMAAPVSSPPMAPCGSRLCSTPRAAPTAATGSWPWSGPCGTWQRQAD
jgi:cystathionine beta-lyase family protein involved in aluminum resistance